MRSPVSCRNREQDSSSREIFLGRRPGPLEEGRRRRLSGSCRHLLPMPRGHALLVVTWGGDTTSPPSLRTTTGGSLPVFKSSCSRSCTFDSFSLSASRSESVRGPCSCSKLTVDRSACSPSCGRQAGKYSTLGFLAPAADCTGVGAPWPSLDRSSSRRASTGESGRSRMM